MLVEIFVFDSDIYQTCKENKEEEKILIIPMIREKMQMRSKNHIKLKKKKELEKRNIYSEREGSAATKQTDPALNNKPLKEKLNNQQKR